MARQSALKCKLQVDLSTERHPIDEDYSRCFEFGRNRQTTSATGTEMMVANNPSSSSVLMRSDLRALICPDLLHTCGSCML